MPNKNVGRHLLDITIFMTIYSEALPQHSQTDLILS